MRSYIFSLFILGLCLWCCVSRRYIYVNQLLTWEQAQQNCREHYTDLATFDSMEDIKTLKRPAFGAAWIGLKDDPQTWKHLGENASTSWRWSSTGETSQSRFESWLPLQPDNYLGEACVGMNSLGQWSDIGCEFLLSSVCSNGTDENMTYAYVSTGMTWSDAQTYCRKHYTDLVTIESSQVNSAVSALIPFANAWIGLYRIPFAWSDGSQSTFRNWWFPGLPDNLGYIQFCALEIDSHQWDDYDCNVKFGFICYAPDLVVSKKTGLRMSLITVTDVTEQFMIQLIHMQLLEILGQNRTDVKLQLKAEPKLGQDTESTTVPFESITCGTL